MINDWDSDIIDFDPIPHTYTNRRTKQRYLGVTSFIKKFEPEFPMEMASAREAYKRYYGKTSFRAAAIDRVMRGQSDAQKLDIIERAIIATGESIGKQIRELQKVVKKEWKDENTRSIIKGHNFHEKQEDKANFNRFSIMQESVKRVADVSSWPRSAHGKINMVHNLPDGLHAEILVSNHKYMLSGQIDRFFIETIDGIRYIDVDDYKTNKKITTENKYQNFNSPIDFLEHSKLNIYRLQLLLYAKLAEFHGFVTRNITITHAPNSVDTPTIYRIIPYRIDQDPIKLMLDCRINEIKSLKL